MVPTPVQTPVQDSDWHDRITQSIDYRASKFDKAWKEIMEYATVNSSRFDDSALAKGLGYAVKISYVKMNAQRKVAMLSAFDFFPVIESDAADLPNHQTVVQMALRWGWNECRANQVLTEMLDDFITLSIAGGQVFWDKYALDGRGAPRAIRKDMSAIYFDPNRRQADINLDCRWVIDRQCLTLDAARAEWPEYYNSQYRPPASSGSSYSNGMAFFYADEEKLRDKNGYVDVARVEFINYVDGKKRVYEGIMDLSNKMWVVPPQDNGLGIYTYFFMNLPLRRGHAYPDVDSLPEIEVADLINAFHSIYIEDAARTAAPSTWVRNTDESAKDSLQNGNVNMPGGIGYFDGEKPPEAFISPRATKALEAAQLLKAELESTSMQPSILTGNAPSGVRSGRALDTLEKNATTPMRTFEIAQVEAGIAMAGIVYAINRKFLKAARFLTIRDDQNENVVLPVNLAEDSQEFARAQGLELPDKYMAQTARVMDEQGQVQVVPRNVAAIMKADNEALTVVPTLNDIAYGNATARIQIKPRMSQQDTIILFQNFLSIGAVTPYDAFKKIGIEGAEEIVARADARNQVLQAGKWVTETPMIAALYSRPDLFQMVATMLQKEIEEEPPKKEPKNVSKP